MEQSGNYKLILDLPSKEPALGFNEYAEALADIVSTSDPRFVVGIFGPWGSGKTTLMEAVKKRLDDSDSAGGANIITVPFSAWRYEREENLILPLLDEVRECLVGWSSNSKGGTEAARGAAAKAASTVGKVTKALFAGISLTAKIPGIVDATINGEQTLAELRRASAEGSEENEADADDSDGNEADQPRSFYFASFLALRRAFEEFNKAATENKLPPRIVVFVDDLDRCLPEAALQVVESMKLFFDLPGFIFVVGLNKRVVSAMVDRKYASPAPTSTIAPQPGAEREGGNYAYVSGEEYIRKIFQVYFELPPVKVTQLHNLLEGMYDEADLSDEQKNNLKGMVEDHLEYVVSEEGVNPREIKRYINGYTLQSRIRPNLTNRKALLSIQTIFFRDDWDHVQKALYSYGETFTDAVAQQMRGGNTSALASLDTKLSDLQQSEFWKYVSEGQPGHPLLEAKPLDDYIYAASEAASFPTHNTELLSNLRFLGDAKQALTKRLEQLQQGEGNTAPAFAEPGEEKIVNDVVERIRRIIEKNPDLDHNSNTMGRIKRNVIQVLNATNPKTYWPSGLRLSLQSLLQVLNDFESDLHSLYTAEPGSWEPSPSDQQQWPPDIQKRLEHKRTMADMEKEPLPPDQQ